MPTAPILDPRIARFASTGTQEMGTEHAASILGLSRQTTCRLCEKGEISAAELHKARKRTLKEAQSRWLEQRPGEPLPAALSEATEESYQAAKRHRTCWTITAAALLHYIVKSATGDGELVRQAVAEHCPAWTPRVMTWLAEKANPLPAPLPENVIPMRRARTAKLAVDPYKGHPDLFASLAS